MATKSLVLVAGLSWVLVAGALATLSGGPDGPSNDDVILPPRLPSQTMPTRLLVLVPGANVDTSYYHEPAMAIQDLTRSVVNLWIVVPSVPLKKCITLCPSSGLCFLLQDRVQSAVAKAVAMGYNGSTSDDVFMGGHSLGGVCAGNLAQGYSGTAQSYSALILLGSYVQGFDVAAFPLPVFTVGAELDGGLARPGITAKSLASSDAAAATHGTDWQLASRPVVVLKGLDHSSFCPGFRVPGDVWPADTPFDEGVGLTGAAVGAFLTLRMGAAAPAAAAAAARKLLAAHLAWTRELLSPLLKAMVMEGQLSPASLPVIGVAPWCATAQRIIANLDSATATDVALRAQLVAPGDFEHSRAGYAKVAGGGVEVNVSGDAVHYGTGVADVANSCLAPAKQIGCKLVSGARLAALRNTSVGPQRSCADVNAEAVRVARTLLSQTEAGRGTLSRHDVRGRRLCTVPDRHTIGDVGPLFVHGSVSYSDNASCLAVAALALGPTPLDSLLFPGVHYCQLLSPARVIDYFMVDSLKNASGCLNTGPGGPVPLPPPPPPPPPPLPRAPTVTLRPQPAAELLAAGSTPCCKTCAAPQVKYFSVDVPHGFCGETCLRPAEFPVFKVFEKNLTRYNGTGPSPCAEQFTPWGTHYTNYTETVTHGVWPLSCTLDLYAPEPPPVMVM
uniref:Chlorophyllase n=1 Tax=Calcidiscus leptoporus TaxID=127549 RepID=A0A7S0J1I7_9EUKA|mmetsp:Transcript_33683/g.78817  ORF Transcript_33683/g.78817 Transcript_33683/m.78817 type:complete len:672 (+) Transcript_33683:33-2048(+)